MINNRVINSIKFLLVTILAIFCFYGNVLARGNEGLGDANDTVANTTNSGTVTPAAGINVNGVSCRYFKVSVNHNASKTHAGQPGVKKTASGLYTGPYIDNQGNMVYDVVGDDIGCAAGANAYTAFCLDPNFDGVKTGQTLRYKAEPINLNSEFGKRIYALYQLYQADTTADPDQKYFDFEVAARILAVRPGADGKSSGYQTRSNTAKARFNSHLKPYQEGTVGGTSGARGAQLANQAIANAQSSNITDVMNSTLGVSLNQVGGAISDGNTYGILVNVNVENCQKPDCVPDDGSGITLDADATLQGVTMQGTTKVFTYEIKNLSSDECIDRTLNVTLEYDSAGDIREAMQISPIDKVFDDRQNYIVFSNNGNGGNGDGSGPNGSNKSVVRNSLPISTCDDGNNDGDGNGDGTIDSCPSDAQLACDEDDENFVVVNEGSLGGGDTDWINCIIGHTDANGNSYDVVNTSMLYRSTATQDIDESNAAYDRTDAILGYTSNNSGGGSISGDSHSIDDANFCVISCKEKYAFILPGNKREVKQGTYFSFQVDHNPETHAVVGVSAERTCIATGVDKSGKSTATEGNNDSYKMDTQNFNNRVLDLRKQQVDFYNMYLYYKQLYNAMNSTEVMDQYINGAKRDIEVTLKKLDVGEAYKVRGPRHNGRTPADILIANESEFKDNNWLDDWDGSNVKINVKYCTLNSPDDPKSEINCNNTKSVSLGSSFQESGIALQINNSGYSFYNQYYSDYSNAWNTHMEKISGKSEIYDQQTSIVAHEYEYCSGKTTLSDEEIEMGVPSDYEYYLGNTFYTGCGTKKTYYATVKYLPEFNKWTNHNKNDKVYEGYADSMEVFINAYEAAYNKYSALNAQIGIQSNAMQECTNYLETFDKESSPYRFDPVITFSYDNQSTYMKMLSPNRLENMHEGTPTLNYETYFCENGGICLGNNSSGSAEVTEFKFGNIFELDNADSSKTYGSISEALADGNINGNALTSDADTTSYYNVASVGSRSTYGRYTYNGEENCTSSYIPNKGSRSSYCYEFYQSAKQFFTQAPDGIVTTSPSGSNKTILSTDGRVYPVAITTPPGKYKFELKLSQIGQYNESRSLGRIMGGGDGKSGTMSGTYGDAEVCYYEVCRIDDEDCGGNGNSCTDDEGVKHDCGDLPYEECVEQYCPSSPTPTPDDGSCKSIVNSKVCNYGTIPDVQSYSNFSFDKCQEQLFNNDKENCCDEVKYIGSQRGNRIAPSIWKGYNEKCLKSQDCIGFRIVDTQYEVDESNVIIADVAKVINDGALQVNARAVSLNNLFPNDEKGFNWKTSDALHEATEIEEIGDGIFEKDCRSGEDGCRGLDYSAIINAKCADEIRKYNIQEEGNNTGYGNGGFNDYTNSISNSTTDIVKKDDIKNDSTRPGTETEMSQSFRALIEQYCSFEGKPAPDLIVDSSSFVLEPWNDPNSKLNKNDYN